MGVHRSVHAKSQIGVCSYSKRVWEGVHVAKRQSFHISGETFTTKEALRDRIRGIVAAYSDEQELSVTDLTFTLAVLDRHPQAETKVGCGVASMTVRTNPVYRSNRGFYLIRVDGTGTDWSWTECLNPTPHPRKVIRAMRVLVEPQTLAFKHAFFAKGPQVCELTGALITFVGSHVDHIPPLTFEKLVADFLEEYRLDIGAIPLRDELADNNYVDAIDDDFIAVRWIEYHRSHAALRVVSRLGNLSNSKLERKAL